MDKMNNSETRKYFSHDSNARYDNKLIRLRMRHGAAGYGVYFMILERLREEDDYMSVKDYNMIAFDLRVDAALVKSVVEDFGLFAFADDGKCFYSESFNRRMGIKDTLKRKRSEAGKKGSEVRWGSKNTPSDNSDNSDYSDNSDNSDYSDNSDNSDYSDHSDLSPVDNDECLKRFFAKSNAASIEALLMGYRLKPKDLPVLKKAAKETVNEWELANKKHYGYTDWSQHLISTMRIKVTKGAMQDDAPPPSPADYQYSGGFGSKDV